MMQWKRFAQFSSFPDLQSCSISFSFSFKCVLPQSKQEKAIENENGSEFGTRKANCVFQDLPPLSSRCRKKTSHTQCQRLRGSSPFLQNFKQVQRARKTPKAP